MRTSEFAENKRRCLYIYDLGCEFKNSYDNPGLQNELYSHPYVKHSAINIRDALYRPRKHTSVKQGKNSVIWMFSVCTPIFVSTPSSLYFTRMHVGVDCGGGSEM
jgi:hypothetical protein